MDFVASDCILCQYDTMGIRNFKAKLHVFTSHVGLLFGICAGLLNYFRELTLHSTDSIQSSDHIAIFISLISLFSGQNLEV